jgi:type IV fimbrial biogenesis protein FimT
MKLFFRQSGFTILETLMVIAIIGVVATIAIPQVSNSVTYFRLSGDARSVSNAVALAKMRAASNFSKTRIYVSTASGWHRIERADNNTPPHWTAEGGVTYLNSSSSFSSGSVSTPPPNSQAAVANAAACRNDAGTAIAGTACIVFNSRGVPVRPDVAGTTYTTSSDNVLYVTDSGQSAIYGITVAATGMIRMWQTLPTATPEWTTQ